MSVDDFMALNIKIESLIKVVIDTIFSCRDHTCLKDR